MSGQDAQSSALNGAQVSSLLEIVSLCAAAVEDGMPRDTAIGVIVRAFNVTPAEASNMLGTVGTSAFTPAVIPNTLTPTVPDAVPTAPK